MVLHEEQFLISITSPEALPSKPVEQMEAFCLAVVRCCFIFLVVLAGLSAGWQVCAAFHGLLAAG